MDINQQLAALKDELEFMREIHPQLIKKGKMTANQALDREDEIHAEIDRLKESLNGDQ